MRAEIIRWACAFAIAFAAGCDGDRASETTVVDARVVASAAAPPAASPSASALPDASAAAPTSDSAPASTASVGGPGAGPVANIVVGSATVSKGSVSNVAPVVAGMAEGLRACYTRGLAVDPTMKGTLQLKARVLPSGEVGSVGASNEKGLSAEVRTCMIRHLADARFSPPSEGEAIISFPVTALPQQAQP